MTLQYNKSQQLQIEDTLLSKLADQYGTPLYVYSLQDLKHHFLNWKNALRQDDLVCFAVKANSNLGILSALASMGSGFDIVSVNELKRVIHAGGNPSKVIFSGVGKTEVELKYALEADIACFNVESESEIKLLEATARNLGKTAPISIRVNPNIDAQTHPYISTGLAENKFGIHYEQAIELYKSIKDSKHLCIKGIDCHIGSQLSTLNPLLESLDAILNLVNELKQNDIHIEHIDLGGGLGVRYKDETPPTAFEYLQQVKLRMQGLPYRLIFEPGRSIVASAGSLLTQVIHLKSTPTKNFAIVDAAMNDFLRPALYQAWVEIMPVCLHTNEEKLWSFVGPVCESADFFANNRPMSLQTNSLLCIKNTGAYGFCMASNYNSRCRPAEVLVDGKNSYLVQQRESFADIIQGEHLLDQELLKTLSTK